MKTKRLICPKCGNTEDFRVDVEIQIASAMLEIYEDEAVLDIDLPNDVDIMTPVCCKCGTEIDLMEDTAPDVLCPSCIRYVEGVLVEKCTRHPHYPYCFDWKHGNSVELNL